MENRYIVMVGTAGAAAALEAAANRAEEVRNRFPGFFLKQGEMLSEQQKKLSGGVPIGFCAQYELNLSGKSILMALWELGEELDTGFEVVFDSIPLDQFTIEITELFGLNPYEEKTGEGRLLVLTDPERALEELKKAGLAAAVIGKLTPGKARTAVTAEGIRYLNSK